MINNILLNFQLTTPEADHSYWTVSSFWLPFISQKFLSVFFLITYVDCIILWPFDPAIFFPVTASFKSTHFYPIIPDKANYLRISVLKSFFSLLHAMSFRISLFSISHSDLHWEIIVFLRWKSKPDCIFLLLACLGTYHFTESGRWLYIFQF